jgi:hypothetical protein
MAGDWIKMRTDLYRDPKVIGIAESLWDPEGLLGRHVSQMCQSEMTVTLNVLRNVTVGALVSVWGIARHQGRRVGDDLMLDGVGLRTLDDIAEIPGFGSAMHDVGWVKDVEEGLCFPKFFKEHNADPTDTYKQKNRERQERYRQRHSNVSPNVIVTHREEKNREENKDKKSARNFVKPSIEEVQAYCRERGKGVNAQQWYDHYESNGWKVGRNAMKDWKAAVRKWEHSDFGSNGKPVPPAADKPWSAIRAEKFTAMISNGVFVDVHRLTKTPTTIRGTTKDGQRYQCIDYPLPEPTHA